MGHNPIPPRTLPRITGSDREQDALNWIREVYAAGAIDAATMEDLTERALRNPITFLNGRVRVDPTSEPIPPPPSPIKLPPSYRSY